MSLDKAIEHKKELRKPYRGSKRFDRSCRNHGNCGYCEGNRKFRDKKLREAATSEIKEDANEQSET
jgi:hypothetical protein